MAKLRSILHDLPTCVDLTKPEKPESPKDQESGKVVEVQDLSKSSDSTIEEEDDNSDPEWLKWDLENQEPEDDDTTIDDEDLEGEAVVIEATMISVGASIPLAATWPVVSVGPPAIVNTIGKDKGGKEKGQKEKQSRQIADHEHVSKLVRDYWRHFNDYSKGRKKATKKIVLKKV